MKASFPAILALAASALSAQTPGNPIQLEFHHATASVADMNRAIKWYTEKLGFKVTLHKRLNQDVDLAWLVIPGFRVDLIQFRNSTRPAASQSSGDPGLGAHRFFCSECR